MYLIDTNIFLDKKDAQLWRRFPNLRIFYPDKPDKENIMMDRKCRDMNLDLREFLESSEEIGGSNANNN